MFNLKSKIKKFVSCAIVAGSLMGNLVCAFTPTAGYRIDVVSRPSCSDVERNCASLLNNYKLVENSDALIFKGHSGERYLRWCKLSSIGNKTYYALERGYPYDAFNDDWNKTMTFVTMWGEVTEEQYKKAEEKKVTIQVGGKKLFDTSDAFIAPSINKYRKDGFSLYFKNVESELREMPLHLGYQDDNEQVESNMLIVEETKDGKKYKYPQWLKNLAKKSLANLPETFKKLNNSSDNVTDEVFDTTLKNTKTPKNKSESGNSSYNLLLLSITGVGFYFYEQCG